MLINSNFTYETRQLIFTLGPQMHQAAPRHKVQLTKIYIIFDSLYVIGLFILA